MTALRSGLEPHGNSANVRARDFISNKLWYGAKDLKAAAGEDGSEGDGRDNLIQPLIVHVTLPSLERADCTEQSSLARALIAQHLSYRIRPVSSQQAFNMST